MILAATGHRPDKLGGRSADVTIRLCEFAERQLLELKPRFVIVGMALGWDTAVAQAAFSLRIPYVAAIPFFGQEKVWSPDDQRMYLKLVQGACKVVIVCSGGFEAYKMQRRNRWMVDKAQAVLAMWNGTGGGTANCIRYAEEKRRTIINVWNEWQCPQKAT